MASMAAPYGVRERWRKAVIALTLIMLAAVPVAGAAPVRLLVLGDSLSAGYGLAQTEGFESQLAAALRADGHDVRIIDGAVSGDTSAGGLARLDWVLGGGADAAIVELGANDGLRGVDPADTEANLTAILDKPGTSSAMAIAAIQSTTGISSDGDMARVLLDAANRYSNDPGVNAALRKAVESLHSDGEYRTVMSEIARHRGSL